MIRVECTCGEVFTADEAHVGKHLRCRRCGRTVMIARTEPGPVPAVGATPRTPQPATAGQPPATAPARARRVRRGGFCASAGSQAFDEPFRFYVTDFGDSLEVMSHSVTLHRVKGGNAPSHPIPDSLVVLPGG